MLIFFNFIFRNILNANNTVSFLKIVIMLTICFFIPHN